MKKILIMALIAIGLVGFSGCSSKNPETDYAKTLKNKHNELPSWVTDDDDDFAAVGSASWKGQSYSFQKNEAIAVANMNLARKLEVKVNSMVQIFYQATGAGISETNKNISTIDELSRQVSTQVTQMYLRGLKQTKTYISTDGELFVKMEMDPENANKSILNALKSSAVLRQQAQADKGFEALDKQIYYMNNPDAAPVQQQKPIVVVPVQNAQNAQNSQKQPSPVGTPQVIQVQ